jgi:hypothetical protein
MEILASAVALIVLTVAFTFLVRTKDIPSVPPISPTHHLEERRAAIYENLRDLQFEYRVGKLSDADYQQTKLGLQKELAGVMAEMDRMKTGGPERVADAVSVAVPVAAPEAMGTVCPHCNAEFQAPMKFCGECGKAMV